MEENKVSFEGYGLEFSNNDFDSMSVQEVQECKDIISDIRKLLEG